MKVYKIPPNNKDLKKFAIWKNAKYLLAFIAYISVGVFAFVLYLSRRHENAEPLGVWVYLAFSAVLLVSGWMICCMSRFVFDRSLWGRIGEVRLSRDFGRGLNRKAGLAIDFHTYMMITVEKSNGKRKRVKVPLFEDGYDGYYVNGGTMIKFRGLNYPLCLESERNNIHMCAVCGVRTNYNPQKQIDGELIPEIRDGQIICRCCNHTIINAEELQIKRDY